MLEIPMYKGKVKSSNTALLVVDMQKVFFDNDYSLGRAGMDVTPLKAAIPGTLKLLEIARSAGIPVIFTRFVFSKDMVDFPRHRRERNSLRVQPPCYVPVIWRCPAPLLCTGDLAVL